MSRPDEATNEDDLGTLERAGDHSVLRYRRRLSHPPDKVWRALTEDEHLTAWFPTTVEGRRAAGAPCTSPSERARASRSTARCSRSTHPR